MSETLAQRFVVPALRKVREGRGTRFVGGANVIKGRATPPTASTFWTNPAGVDQSGLGEDFLSSFCRVSETLAQVFVVPVLRKVREGRGTRFVGGANGSAKVLTRNSGPA